jgi:glycosyltransferase involved in cell wall biosynthesis
MPESTFVIIPTFNEERVIRSTLESLLEYDYSIVVVDDGSRDGTWDIVNGLPVYALRHPVNLGQGAALQTGMVFSLQQGAKILVHFDADGQHRPEEIQSLAEPIERGEAEVVLGSRFLRQEDALAVPSFRRIILRGAILINGLFTGLWLSDAHNGLRAFSAAAARQIKLRENGYAHATEINAEIKRLKLHYVERPTHISYSSYATSKGQSLWNSLNILIDVLLRKVFR